MQQHEIEIIPSLVTRTDSTGSQSQSEIGTCNKNIDPTIKVSEMHKSAPAEITRKHSNDNECTNDTIHANNNHDDETPYMENEPESLQLLHASVTHDNMYDPYVPNDYLAYRERKRSEEVRKELQRTALQRLEQQENLRKQIEAKRKKLLESGNFQGLVEEETMASRRNDEVGEGVGMGIGRGRGRGRGVTNLPAWLIKKQGEQQSEIKTEALNSDATGTDGQFDDSVR